MTTQNLSAGSTFADVDSETVQPDSVKNKPLTDEERERIRDYYRSLNFKEFLAACPIDGIDLTREPEYPREIEL